MVGFLKLELGEVVEVIDFGFWLLIFCLVLVFVFGKWEELLVW